MPDYYGTGRQPKSGRSYVGLAVGLVIALLAANALPFLIPYLQRNQETVQRIMPSEQKRLTFRTEDCQQPQTAVCGMLICELDETQQRYWELPNGVIVSQVDADSAAANAGVLPGDVIVRIGENAPECAADCRSLLSAYSDGGFVPLTVYRSGEEIEIVLTYSEE